MGMCETCGNLYDKVFEVVIDGRCYVFDSFECAIHSLAPRCSDCGCKIVGHGVEVGEAIYCCAHCAHRRGAYHVKDRG